VRRLIVNADDFGLTFGINRAIRDLHVVGALTSATVMAASPRFDDAAALARECPTLAVGCHIVLLDGTPAGDPASVSSLLDSSNGKREFRPTMGHFVRDLALGRIASVEIEREAAAQIRRVQRAGLPVTHVDTHKHTHIFPPVLKAVLRAAASCGVRAIRNPFEPAWSVDATPNANFIRRSEVQTLRIFRHNFQHRVREHGFATTNGCLGVLATGTLNEQSLRSILTRMSDGTWELVCHPAYMDDELRGARTRLQESRAVELDALENLPRLLTGNVHRIGFGQL
jgi:chitin disaccharide deacetylase